MNDSNSTPMESAEEQAETKKLDSQNDNTIGGGYKAPRQKRFKLTGRQKAAGGGVAGLLIGGGIGIFTIISGPLQFIHIAQLLQQFHFQSGQDTGNSRILKMYKWTKNARAGSAENARLSYLGKKIAVKMDARLAEAGISKNFSDTGLYKNTEIDALKFSEYAANGEDFKRLPPEEFKTKFEEKFGLKLKDPPGGGQTGTFIIDDEGFLSAYFKNRKLNKLIVSEVGQDGIGGSVTARIMGKRDGVSWHPIKRLDAKIVGTLDEKFTAFLKQLKERITSGEKNTPTASGAKDVNPDDPETVTDNPNNNAGAEEVSKAGRAASDAVDGVESDAGSVAKGSVAEADGLLTRFTGSTTGKLGLGATAIIGLVCAAQAISKAVDQIKHDLVILPLVRTGMQAISVGNQVMSGQDLSSEQLGFFAKQLYDPETKSSWASAKSIQAELGQEQTGQDIPDEINIKKLKEGNAFTQFLSSIPGLDMTCELANSTVGRIVQFAVSLTTPVATLLTTAVMESPPAKAALASMVRWLAGSPIPSFVRGSTYGNYVNYGSRLASNNAAAAVGGSKLTTAQALEIKKNNIAMLREENSNKSLSQKVFDVKSPHSLVSIAIDNSSTDFKTNFASILANVTNPSKFLATIKLPFSSRISAASNYDYGFDKIGFSLADLEDSKYDNPYDNAEKAKALLAGDAGKNYRELAYNCFGVTISEDGDTITTDFGKKVDPTEKDYPNDCSNTSENWTRIRFYVLDMKTAEATDCYDSGDSQSCQNVGFNGVGSTATNPTTAASASIVGDPYTESESVSCAQGTKDLGVFDAYSDGKPVRARLCALKDILSSSGDESNPRSEYFLAGADGAAIVNSRVSGAWASLVKAAQSEGVALSATSSFRTMQHQEKLCQGNTGCRNGDNTGVARPGYSSHQAGVAIDFSLSGGNNAKSGRSCDNRDTRPDTQYQWLRANASRFGFNQYANEAWHFDALPNENRCL